MATTTTQPTEVQQPAYQGDYSILRRYAEFKGNSGKDIICERDGKTIPYADLVKEVSDRG